MKKSKIALIAIFSVILILGVSIIISFFAAQNAGPTIFIGVGGPATTVGSYNVTVLIGHCTGQDIGDPLKNVSLNYGDGNISTSTFTQSFGIFVHNYRSSGNYVVKVVVTNIAGHGFTKVANITIPDNGFEQLTPCL